MSYSITDSEVHVWQIPLIAGDDEVAESRGLLSPDELRRADRFVFAQHRTRFIVGRASMRQILGACLHRRPSDVKFLYENLGKPFLDKRDNPDELAFNFSNSRDLGLLAVTGRCPHLGVDLEYVRWPRDLTGLAERFFDAGETEMLLAAPMAEQQQAFFRLWTRKEAFLKAVGKGLTFPLKDVVVTQRAEEPARILSIQGSATAANDWYVESLRLPADYIGAVVYSGFQRGVFVREYT